MSPPVAIRIVVPALAILSAVAHWFVPRLSRPDIYFAVTVAPGFRDTAEGRRILQRYRRGLMVATALALGVLGALAMSPGIALEPLALPLQLAMYFGIYYRMRRLVLPHSLTPTTVREAQVASRARRIPGGWLLAAGPFALLTACAGYLYAHWQQIPARLVLHWGAEGQPDRWAARSLAAVFGPFLIAVAILLSMTLLLYAMAHWLRPIHPGGLQGERESRFRRTASIMLIAVEYWIAVLFSWLAIRPLLPVPFQRPPVAVAVIPAVIIAGFTAVLMWLGQGGSRVPSAREPASDSTRPVGDRTEDRFWKLGIFYFNRDDPAVMVEKRFGIGYTVNFAHPVAWIMLLLPILALVATTVTIAVRHGIR